METICGIHWRGESPMSAAVSALYSYEYRTGTKYWRNWAYLLGAGGAFVGYLGTAAIVTALQYLALVR